jgi:AAA+ ATPase superfamily predicted ATPase
MRFIDRDEELRRLDSVLAGSTGGLVVLWGRRRVGKTRLLLEWSGKNDGLYTVADQSSPDIQRRYFAESVARRFHGFDEVEYSDWRSLLRRLAQEAKVAGWRGPLILDEFPYLVAASRNLPSILQRWVDHEASDAGLSVAIAGSSQRMMQGFVMDASSPLYGRAKESFELTRISHRIPTASADSTTARARIGKTPDCSMSIRLLRRFTNLHPRSSALHALDTKFCEICGLKPLNAGYIGVGLGLTKARDCVEAYSVWGGIPRYWEISGQHSDDLDMAVDECVLNPLGPLHREPDRLLMEEVPPSTSLRPILDAMGMGAHRISEIGARLGQPATSLSRPIARLVDLGLVVKQIPYGSSEKSGKRVLYKIADPFFRFWFRAVAPNRALLAEAPKSVRVKIWKQIRQSLFSESWENLCRRSIARLSSVDNPLNRYGPWEPARRYWRGNEPEWDIVAKSIDGKSLLLGEAKWCTKANCASVVKRARGDLLKKGVPSPEKHSEVRLVHAVFVPESAPEAVAEEDVVVLEARTVLDALR